MSVLLCGLFTSTGLLGFSLFGLKNALITDVSLDSLSD